MTTQTRLSAAAAESAVRSREDSDETQAALRKEDAWDRHLEGTLAQLSQLYMNRIEPIETRYDYNVFQPTWFAESIKQKKPFVTFLGPFSAGKSSFINYLLQSNPLLTGPQPVTDKFTVVMYGEKLQHIPGRVLMADSRLPFRGLSQFGDSFSENFAAVLVPHPILRSVSFVDTPGILEAAGSMHTRRYDYIEVCRWFVEKSDLVFFLFDPTKLDAGPELRQVFGKALRNHESKIRIVMNKADSVRPQELMRVYGSLYWNLSNLVRSTEPPRLYVSSFWDKPYRDGTDHALFTKEKEDLLYELIVTIPMQSLDRRVTAMMQRASDVLLFALICATYRSRLPAVFGKGKAKERFFDEYNTIVKDLALRYHVSENNFPLCDNVRSFLNKVESKDFPDMDKLEKKGWISLLKGAIETELPRMLQPIKEHAVGDPRERRNAIMLQRQYIERHAPLAAAAPSTASTPATGGPSQTGGNGAAHETGDAAEQAAAASTAPSTDTQMQMMRMMQQMMAMQQQQQQQQQQAPPQPGTDPMQLMMMQNMMTMMQQQMQNQQPPPQP